jgi:hypothetical protein
MGKRRRDGEHGSCFSRAAMDYDGRKNWCAPTWRMARRTATLLWLPNGFCQFSRRSLGALKAGGEAMRFAGWRARCGRFGSGCGGEGLERADCDGNGHEGSRGVHHALGMKRSAASWLLKPRIHRMRPLMSRWSCSSRLLGSTWSGPAELSDKPRARVVIWPLCDLPGCAASADP